jgi:hypothetical protein
MRPGATAALVRSRDSLEVPALSSISKQANGRGKYSTITFSWSESAKQLTIGAPAGSYPGMPTTRTFNVVFVGANHGVGVNVTATPDHVVMYNGLAVLVMAN